MSTNSTNRLEQKATSDSFNPDGPAAEKDPHEWVTGDEKMTGPQSSYLKTLAHEAHEPVESGLTKAEASEKIEALQEKTGRGRTH